MKAKINEGRFGWSRWLGAAVMVAATGLTLWGCSGERAASDTRLSKNGITAYIGVVPAQMVASHVRMESAATMHGGIPDDRMAKHVVISLFREDGSRIADAEVTGTVRSAEEPDRGESKPLEPFAMAGETSYGNYFRFEMHRSYLIDVSVRVPGSQAPVEFSFRYL